MAGGNPLKKNANELVKDDFADLPVDPDNPEWTEEEFASARPFAEAFPELMENLRRSRGRPVAQVRKQQISIRLDAEVVERFKATGKGWQARINDILKQAKP
jgi:uncharacterized protein (DUF4415 family)